MNLYLSVNKVCMHRNVSVCVCVCVPTQAFGKWRKKQFQHRSQDQHSLRRGRKAKFSTKIFVVAKHMQNHLPSPAPRIFCVLLSISPIDLETNIPTVRSWHIADQCNPGCTSPEFVDFQQMLQKAVRFAILFLAAFLFSLLRSDVSMQYPVSVWTADVLERAIFLS